MLSHSIGLQKTGRINQLISRDRCVQIIGLKKEAPLVKLLAGSSYSQSRIRVPLIRMSLFHSV